MGDKYCVVASSTLRSLPQLGLDNGDKRNDKEPYPFFNIFMKICFILTQR